MIQPIDFVRRPFEIQAIRVTNANMAEVSIWCKSPIKPVGEHDGRQGPYINVKTARPAHPRQGMAFVGDWVTYTPKGGFKVYTNRAFEENFQRKDGSSAIPTDGGVNIVQAFVDRVQKPMTPSPAQVNFRNKPNLASVPRQPVVRDCNG